MTISKQGLSPEIETILAQLPVTLSDSGAVLDAAEDAGISGFSVEKTPDTLRIRYEKKVYLFRALGLAAGICGIAGNYIGVTFFQQKGSKAVKPIMLTVLALFFVRILSEIL